MTICGNNECKKKAIFGSSGDEKAKFCKEHKDADMIDVINKKCYCGKSQPRWNLEGLSARFCSCCKSENMVQPNRKLCKCGKRPCFNFEGLKGDFCNSCKLDGMINVGDKRCVCAKNTSPCFNFEGLRGKYCGTCKLDGMVNVKSPKCGCGVVPHFNFEGLRPKFCSKCKTEGMIDLIHPLCISCNKFQPNFNFVGLKAEYCSKCKNDGMIDVCNKLCFCNSVQPTYNYEGLKAKYCVKCKTNDMIDVKHTKCKTLFCDIRVQEKFEGYCLRCYINIYPDKPVARNYKTKEIAVVEHIVNTFPAMDWITDKKIDNGCSKKRPDLLLDLGYQVIIVEIDENQHQKYNCSCENKRLMELSQDVGHRSIIFIRFNPDDYFDENNHKVKSCWGITKETGISKIINKKDWNSRLESLKKQIEYWLILEHKTDKTIEIIELFYDQNLV